MPDVVIVEILSKVAVEIAARAARMVSSGLRGDPMMAAAINDTSAAFSGVEGVERTLATWSSSSTFLTLLKGLEGGKRELTNPSVAQEFIEATGFFCGDDTDKVAVEILVNFAENLERRIYASPQGVYALGKRGETLHAEVISGIRGPQEDC
jgi:hypothetical protein